MSDIYGKSKQSSIINYFRCFAYCLTVVIIVVVVNIIIITMIILLREEGFLTENAIVQLITYFLQ